MSDADQPLTMQDRLLLASLLSRLPGRNGRADLQTAGFDLEMLLEELHNPNSNVRTAAAAALGNWAGHDPDSTVVKALTQLHKNGDETSERCAAASALGNWARYDPFEIAIDSLLAEIDTPFQEEENLAVAQALRHWANHDPRHRVRDLIISRVRHCRSHGSGYQERLAAFTDTLSHWVGHDADQKALKTLSECGAFTLLTKWIGNEQEGAIIQGLASRLGDRSLEARQPIIDLLAQWDKKVLLRVARGRAARDPREASREGLGLVGAAFQLATNLFQEATAGAWKMNTAAEFYRLSLASVLAELPGRSQISDLQAAGFPQETLLSALGSPSESERKVAALTLGAWAGHDPSNRVRNALIRQLGETASGVRLAIIATLGRWAGRDADHAARDTLIRRLSEDNKHIRAAAIAALGRWATHDADGRVLAVLIRQRACAEVGLWAGHDSGQVALEALINWLDAGDIRRNAIEALGNWAAHDVDGRALKTLRDLLVNQEDVSVRLEVARALGQWSKHDTEGRALQALVDLSDDSRIDVRWAVADSLGQWPAGRLLAAARPELPENQRLNLVIMAMGGQSIDCLAKQPPAGVNPDTLVRATIVCESPFDHYARQAFGCYAGHDSVGKVLELVLVMTRVEANDVRHVAADVLGCWAEHDQDGLTLQALIKLLDDEEQEVRRAARQSLVRWNKAVLLRATQGMLNRNPGEPGGCDVPDWVQKHAKK